MPLSMRTASDPCCHVTKARILTSHCSQFPLETTTAAHYLEQSRCIDMARGHLIIRNSTLLRQRLAHIFSLTEQGPHIHQSYSTHHESRCSVHKQVYLCQKNAQYTSIRQIDECYLQPLSCQSNIYHDGTPTAQTPANPQPLLVTSHTTKQ